MTVASPARKGRLYLEPHNLEGLHQSVGKGIIRGDGGHCEGCREMAVGEVEGRKELKSSRLEEKKGIRLCVGSALARRG